MTVLVTAASKHGATLEIAEAIAGLLAEQGVSAELVPIDEGATSVATTPSSPAAPSTWGGGSSRADVWVVIPLSIAAGPLTIRAIATRQTA